MIFLIIILALVGTPLFLSLFLGAVAGFSAADIDTAVVFVELYRLTSSPALIAIPLFTLAGYILAESGAPARLLNLIEALIGWLPGGISLVALFSAAVFTAFTGASGITIVALGGILLPLLQDAGYDRKYSLGFVTSSGSLGLLFPPSLPLILYGIIAGVSIIDLFKAGILPGMVIILLFYIYAIFQEKERPKRKKFKVATLVKTLREAFWEIPLPFLVLGGIYGGYLTVPDAASVAVVYLFIVEFLIRRELKIKSDLRRIIEECMLLVGGILIVLSSALALNGFFIDQQIPMKILKWFTAVFSGKITFLIALNIFLIVVGCMLDIFSALIITVPLVLPLAQTYGIHPVHLGIIFLTNLEIGYLTPPVGLNLFISSFRFKEPIFHLYKVSLPFLLLLLASLAIIIMVKELSMILINHHNLIF